jgi:CDP-diglyceride synthetase
MSESTYKRIFLLGALWNLLGGLFIIVATDWIFGRDGLAAPAPPAYYQSWIALFMVFGLGYYFVYRDPYRNRDIALLGAIGKLAFTVVFVYNLIAFPRRIPQFFVIPMVGDVVFAILFLMFVANAGRFRKAER